MKATSILSLLLAFTSAVLSADQVIMKNGDRLTGVIVKFEGKDLTLESQFAGTVTIPWEAVTSIKSDEALNVGLKDGQTVVGAVTTSDGRFAIATKDTGVVSAAKESVAFVRNQKEQTAYDQRIERYRNPRIVDLWAGAVDLGFAQSTGNAITSTINSSANASRATSRDKITAQFTSLFARNNVSGRSLLTANTMRGGVGYSLDVSKKLFVYGSTDLEFDEFQQLDLRFVPAGGLGYHAVKSQNTALDFFAGGSLNREFFATGLRRSSAEALFGNELMRKIFGGITTVRQKLVIYPNMADHGEMRINFDLSQATALNKWLAWQVTLSNRYLSNPVPGRKTNDLLITTGLRVTFAP